MCTQSTNAEGSQHLTQFLKKTRCKMKLDQVGLVFTIAFFVLSVRHIYK